MGPCAFHVTKLAKKKKKKKKKDLEKMTSLSIKNGFLLSNEITQQRSLLYTVFLSAVFDYCTFYFTM